jgi:hypothetical protein
MKKRFKRLFDLQLFTAGDNQNQSVRYYEKEMAGLIQAVFSVKTWFPGLFAGGVQVKDGVKDTDNAFYVKTSDVACVVSTGTLTGANASPAYNKGANVGMGTGTGSTSRFGNRTEVIYTDTAVPYTWDWVVHEGIDRHTVNADFDEVVADRLDLQAQKKVSAFNAHAAAFVASAAGVTVTASAKPTAANVVDYLMQVREEFTNNGVDADAVLHAQLTPEQYSNVIKSGLTTTSKLSDANIGDRTITKCAGLIIEEIPAGAFTGNNWGYFYAENIAAAFTGINTARTIESEDFDGVALQGAGKAGEFIPNDNKKALGVATF